MIMWGEISILLVKEFQIPISVKNVRDVHHPRKVGLSDAYLFMHQINGNWALLKALKSRIVLSKLRLFQLL